MAYRPGARGRSVRTFALATTALALCLGAAPALAQDAGGGFTPLGRIVLGFGGAPRVAIDTPQAVTVVSQEDLDREQANTLSDALANVPGVQTAGSPRFSGQAFNIRGIGNTEQAASEARIIVTVDGAPKFFEQYRMGSFFGDLELYKQVEVLRGPASSTLYGAGAIGGVVNFTTKDASDFLSEGSTTALRFKTGFESNGEGLLGSVIYATRVGENAEFLGALNYATSGDAVDGSGAALTGSAFDRMSGLLKGTWRLGDDQDQTVRLSFSRTEGTLDDSVVAQTGNGRPAPGAPGAVASFGNADLTTRDDTLVLGYRHEGAGNPWLDLDVTLSYTNTEVDKRDFSLARSCGPGLRSCCATTTRPTRPGACGPRTPSSSAAAPGRTS
jgi:hemoglobin/transferrin/lactoferrin receptor protein